MYVCMYVCTLIRYLKHQINGLKLVCPEIVDEDQCPACPKVRMHIFMYMSKMQLCM